ncbi:aa3-type cytochrome c oxidase subunit IV [Novosphingobium sp. FSW06-99]|nr:aa3-type cytochrome c oxidase subunit IV [Novosphingobium sp. FSW06-99]
MGSANDIKAARETYEGFIGLIKISVPVIAVIVAFVVYLIH